jgi:mannose-6-phosphate isomerase
VILDARPGARVFVGYEPGWDLERFVRAAQSGAGEEGLRSVFVRRGDVIEIPAGLVHAIGGGILLAEIQQSSDITWRIHDWDRQGLDGRPRALHLLEASQAIPPDPAPPCPLPAPPHGPFWTRAIEGAHFRLECRREDGERSGASLSRREVPIPRRRDRFGILALLEGAECSLIGTSALPVLPGGVVFVPAAVDGELRLEVSGALWALWIEPGGSARD